MVNDLGKLIAIPSISSDKTNVKKALREVLSIARRMGFKAKSELNEQIGVVEIEPYGENCSNDFYETLGILTHVDVVPPGDLELWNTDPFKMTLKDGKLYGRGTIDDKGAIVSSLYAMKYILEKSKPVMKKIQLIIGTQEEVQWTDMDEYVKRFKLPDYGFTPDGEFPLCNIEKGIVDVIMSFPKNNEDYTRRNGNFIEEIVGGHALNAVPGKCNYKTVLYEDGKEKLTDSHVVYGKTVHSCQPELGINGILEAINGILEKSYQNNEILKLCFFINKYFSSMFGEKLGLCSSKDSYNGEFVHRNVFTPTTINTFDDRIELGINSRIAFGTNVEDVKERLKKVAEANGGVIIYEHSMPAVYISKNRPFMKEFAKAYEEATGLKNEFVLAYGGSYAKAIPNIVSWGPIFLGEEDTCHQENEYMKEDSLFKNMEIFALALENIVFNSNSYK